MKPHIIKLTVFALAIFVLANCGKDPEPVNRLIGNWKVNAVETKILVDGMSFKDYLISRQ